MKVIVLGLRQIVAIAADGQTASRRYVATEDKILR